MITDFMASTVEEGMVKDYTEGYLNGGLLAAKKIKREVLSLGKEGTLGEVIDILDKNIRSLELSSEGLAK